MQQVLGIAVLPCDGVLVGQPAIVANQIREQFVPTLEQSTLVGRAADQLGEVLHEAA